jgi:hypothetical protein
MATRFSTAHTWSCQKILCAYNYYLKQLQIWSWDCNGIGFCEAFYCEEPLNLYWWGNIKQHVSVKFFMYTYILRNNVIYLVRYLLVRKLLVWKLIKKIVSTILWTLEGDEAFGQNTFSLDNLHEKCKVLSSWLVKLQMYVLLLSAVNLVSSLDKCMYILMQC